MNQYNVRVGDYFIYLGKTISDCGYTHNKKYVITYVDEFNCYFEDDNGLGVVSHLKDTYTDKEWLFISKNKIRKEKLECLKTVIE